ncbi:MAG: nucleotidyltransferase domain-containing protein [Firmicutes bacterium]|nr:nucleotidyltransferase domain-containing protein [Bacillota bacterium]
MQKLSDLDMVCQKYAIALVYLYGSKAEEGLRHLRGENVKIDDRFTDIDVGVVFKEPLPPPEKRYKLYSSVFNEFEELFRPLPLDLVFLEEGHSVFQSEAIKGYCVYSVDETFKENYEEMILRRAADFRPFLELYLKEALEEA